MRNDGRTRRAIWSVRAVLGICLFSCSYAGAGDDSVKSLNLTDVVNQAIQENPTLKSMRSKVDAMREKPAQEEAFPNPMFTFKGMDMADGGDFPDTNEKRYMLDQSIPWFGKRSLRGKVVGQDVEAMRNEYEAMKLEVVMMVKEAYYDLYGVQKSLAIAHDEEPILQQIEKVATTKYVAGNATQQDVLKAQTEITMLKQRLLELETQETTLKAKLNTLLNQPVDAPLGLAGTAPTGIAVDADPGQLLAVADKNRPEIKSAEAQVAKSQFQRRLMAREYMPDWTLGVEYRKFDDSDDMAMFTIGMDLPVWRSKYRAGVVEAEKMIESSEAARDAAKRQTAFDTRDAQFKVLTTQRTVQLYRNELIPQAEARFAASEAAYRVGKVDFMDLLESERFLFNARIMAAMAEGNMGMQLARLERAIGGDMEAAFGRK